MNIYNINLSDDPFQKIAKKYFNISNPKEEHIFFVSNNYIARSLKEIMMKNFKEGSLIPSIVSISDVFSFDISKIIFIVFEILKNKAPNLPLNTIFDLAHSMSELIKKLFFANISQEYFEKNINENYKSSYAHTYEFIKICFENEQIQKYLYVRELKYTNFLQEVQKNENFLWAIALTDIHSYAEKLLNIIADHKHGHVVLVGSEYSFSKNCLMNEWILKKFNVSIPSITEDFLKNLAYEEYNSLSEEAENIALCVRKAKFENKKVTIVSGNDELSRKIKNALKKWNIFINDSSGSYFRITKSGIIAGSALSVMSSNFSILTVLELLKISENLSPSVFEIENLFRKKISTPKNFFRAFDFLNKDLDLFSEPFLDTIKALRVLYSQPLVHFNDFKNLHIKLTRFVSDKAANELLKIFQNFSLYNFGKISLEAYVDFYTNQIASLLVRDEGKYSEGIFLIGLAEAQLISSDLIIVASVNEESWSIDQQDDFWLSKRLIKVLKLPSEDQKDDLLQCIFERLIAKNEVIITRSLKSSGKDLRKYRLIDKYNLTRFSNKLLWLSEIRHNILNFKREIINKPEPMPPIDLRPLKLYVSDIEALINNPYKFYAKYILKLREIREINQVKNIKGNVTHNIYQTFGGIQNECDFYKLEKKAKEVILGWHLDIKDIGMWYFLIKNIIKFWLDNTNKDSKIFSEIYGECELKFDDDHKLNLCCRADRIDVSNGLMTIIDYKTGKPPSDNSIKKGEKPQLVLEALIAQEGGFNVDTKDISSAEFWFVNGKIINFLSAECSNKKEIKDINELVKQAKTEISKLIKKYIIELAPYSVNMNTKIYSGDPYVHLSRLKEWSNA